MSDIESPWDDKPSGNNATNSTATVRSRYRKSIPVTQTVEGDPLGPLGGGNDDDEEEDQPLGRSQLSTISQKIENFKENKERLALFGETKSQVRSVEEQVEGLSIGGATTGATAVSSDHSQNNQSNNNVPAEEFDISVGDPIKISDLTSAHTVYTVTTKTSSPNFSKSETSVTRRYRDFRWVFHALEDNNPGIIIPPPPEKQAVGRFDDDFVEARRAALENMLKKIAKHHVLQNDPDFKIFLESETFSIDIKQHNIQQQPEPKGGFMSSLGFGFSGKFVETDEWFVEKKTYIDSLETQFKYFSKSLEVVIAQRKDLSDATSELGNILSSLSNVELSKSFSELIGAFSDTQNRIHDLYFRQCLQDVLSLSTTLEEYIRLVSSIRTTFSQRQKAYFTLQNQEQELSKKQSNLNKLTKQGKTLQDKIAVLTQDVRDQEAKVLNARVAFDEIGKTIQKEFARFEKEKAEDFRNSVELYLENAIEAQKEAIEIWETFYRYNITQAASEVPVQEESEIQA